MIHYSKSIGTDRTNQDEAKLCQKKDKLKKEVGWQVKKVPSTAFSFAENFPQALVYADKYLKQQQKKSL